MLHTTLFLLTRIVAIRCIIRRKTELLKYEISKENSRVPPVLFDREYFVMRYDYLYIAASQQIIN